MAHTRKNQPAIVFDKRTLTVWASLVGSLSLVSGLLFALDPTPHAPAPGPVLTVLDPSPDDLEGLLSTAAESADGRWKGIVVSHSGESHGNADTLGRAHQQDGFGGLTHHFVIGNGDGAYDGEIQAGHRWLRQLDGTYAEVVSICLIGSLDITDPTRAQMQQLVKIVTSLQRRLGIPASKVYLQREVTETTSPGLLFPSEWFRQQLIDPDPAT